MLLTKTTETPLRRLPSQYLPFALIAMAMLTSCKTSPQPPSTRVGYLPPGEVLVTVANTNGLFGTSNGVAVITKRKQPGTDDLYEYVFRINDKSEAAVLRETK